LEVFEAIQKRRSVRKYMDKEVPMELILKVLEAGRLAPSAHNSQPWHYIVVTDPEIKRKIAKVGDGLAFLKTRRWLLSDAATVRRHRTGTSLT